MILIGSMRVRNCKVIVWLLYGYCMVIVWLLYGACRESVGY